MGLPTTTAMAGDVSDANVVWTSPSADSNGSMPLGNGQFGINLWVEPNGDLLFYLSATDSWSENNRLLKFGLVRVSGLLDPGQSFSQELDLATGSINIQAGTGTDATTLSVWVDANNPTVHIESHSARERTAQVLLGSWRTQTHQLSGAELNAAYGLHGGSPDTYHVTADTVLESEGGRISWYHRNESSIYADNLSYQGLDPETDASSDPLINRTFGAWIEAPGYFNTVDAAICSEAAMTDHTISIHMLTAQTPTAQDWIDQIAGQVKQTNSQSLADRRAAHDAWWAEFNSRGYIRLSGDANADRVSRAYAVQRAVSAFSGRGGSPIKFNGSIFTVDTQTHGQSGISGLDADTRRWGSAYWWQNTRLPYWAMAAAGDAEMMLPLFDMYLAALPLAQERVQTYWGHEGAMFPESMYFWGTYNDANYGWPSQRGSLPDGTSVNQFIRYEWQVGIELVAMMLEYYNTTRDEQFLTDKLLPMAEAIITFYDQHYDRDAQGQLEISGHAQVLETWWNAVNPMPEIAGLHYILDGLLALPEELLALQAVKHRPTRGVRGGQLDAPLRQQWSRLKSELPDLPTRMVGGTEIFAPADQFSDHRNTENGELYCVFPYLLSGVGQDNLQMGIDTFNNRFTKRNIGWDQEPIQAALLGLTNVAQSQITSRVNATNNGFRFDGFYGPNFDYAPDQDHISVFMIALQKMLMQVNGDDVVLFAAWPTAWDAEFKLHGPAGAIIMGEFADGGIAWIDPSLDGRIGVEDFDLLLANWDYSNGQETGDYATLQRGDVNLDGRVNHLDLFALIANWGSGDSQN